MKTFNFFLISFIFVTTLAFGQSNDKQEIRRLEKHCTALLESKSQFDAKVNTMEEQMKNAGERRKTKIEKRIYEIKEEHRLRTEKLKQASKLIGEAIGPKEDIQKTAKANVL